jgi:hypothetical protein
VEGDLDCVIGSSASGSISGYAEHAGGFIRSVSLSGDGT